MLKWKKLGKVFDPRMHKTEWWMAEYAQLPFPFLKDHKTLRVYFATRPKKGDDHLYVSRSGYVDLDRNDLSKVMDISPKPIFDLGGAGTFDEFGSMTSSFVSVDDKIYAYYTGWSRLHTVPYTMAIGLAISEDGGNTFQRISDGPILGITKTEPYLLSGPIVKIIDGTWHMWYLSGSKWLYDNHKFEPVYKIVHATSFDGIDWNRNGVPIISSKLSDECQVSFALFYYNEKWNVIFAYRKPLDFRNNKEHAYRLGYAWSNDLEKWNRDDSQSGLNISKDGWDSEMIAYPQVGEIDGKILLFYCGNNFGFEGFGAAELIMN